MNASVFCLWLLLATESSVFAQIIYTNLYNDGCGKTFHEQRHAVFKLVGGVEAVPYSWPWQISIQYLGGHNCGGSLLSNQWIMTAAHCLQGKNKRDITVKVGVFDVHTGQELQIEEMHVHPKFRMGGKLIHDIGLVKLKKQIHWNDKQQPICLALNDDKYVEAAGNQMTVTGWGATTSSGLGFPDNLMQVNLEIMDFKRCVQHFRIPSHYINYQLCVTTPGKGTCNGDSGGPLVSEIVDPRNGQSRWYQYGIVSGAYSKKANCADENGVGIFTRVSAYCNWIQEITGRRFCN